MAFPSARLLGGNTATGLYKDDTLDDLVEDEDEGGPQPKDGPGVVLCLERVKEVHGFTLDGTTLSKSIDKYIIERVRGIGQRLSGIKSLINSHPCLVFFLWYSSAAVGAAETLSSFISGLSNLSEQGKPSSLPLLPSRSYAALHQPLFPSHLILIAPGNASPVLEPLLVHLRRIAGTLVRNAATLGGNIVLARLKVPDTLLPSLTIE